MNGVQLPRRSKLPRFTVGATFGTTVRNFDKNTDKKMRAKMTKASSYTGHDSALGDDNINEKVGAPIG